MNETNKKIKVSDVEDIKLQADIIVGLSNVFALFLDFTKEDEDLRGGMECLVNEASRLQESLNALYDKLFPKKEINIGTDLE